MKWYIIMIGDKWFAGFHYVHPGTQPRGHRELLTSSQYTVPIREDQMDQAMTDIMVFSKPTERIEKFELVRTMVQHGG